MLYILYIYINFKITYYILWKLSYKTSNYNLITNYNYNYKYITNLSIVSLS